MRIPGLSRLDHGIELNEELRMQATRATLAGLPDLPQVLVEAADLIETEDLRQPTCTRERACELGHPRYDAFLGISAVVVEGSDAN